MSIDNVRKSSSPRGLFIGAAVLLLLGVGAIVRYVVGAANQGEGSDQSDGIWQPLTVIAAAVLVGTGLVLLVLGIIRRRRRETHADDRRSKL